MEKLVLFYPQGHQGHYERGHPERPERVEAIRDGLIMAKLWERFPKIPPTTVPNSVLEGVHNLAYLSSLQRACQHGSGHLDMDTYFTDQSWDLALQAAGGATAVAKTIWLRKAKSGLALCRPPGHHAMRGQGMGFCLINNIAVAAEFLLREEGAQRIAIVDLDLHHGNGTQDIFWERNDVMFISIHQSPLYPGSGALKETGRGEGLGYTLNFPMPPRSGDEAYISVMDSLLLPVLDRFNPEILLVSYGFDPHWSDPLGHLQLSASGMGRLIGRMADFAEAHCQGRIALVLEGGYDLDAARVCSLAVVYALIGEAWQDDLGPSPIVEGDQWKSVLKSAREMWQV